jgi:hypothetical protein
MDVEKGKASLYLDLFSCVRDMLHTLDQVAEEATWEQKVRWSNLFVWHGLLRDEYEKGEAMLETATKNVPEKVYKRKLED